LSSIIFTSSSDLNSNFIISNENFEKEIISKICEKCSNETSYKITEIINPKKNSKYRKIEKKEEKITNVTMEKIGKLFKNDERENLFEIFENFYQNFNFEFGTEHDNLYIAGIYITKLD